MHVAVEVVRARRQRGHVVRRGGRPRDDGPGEHARPAGVRAPEDVDVVRDAGVLPADSGFFLLALPMEWLSADPAFSDRTMSTTPLTSPMATSHSAGGISTLSGSKYITMRSTCRM